MNNKGFSVKSSTNIDNYHTLLVEEKISHIITPQIIEEKLHNEVAEVYHKELIEFEGPWKSNKSSFVTCQQIGKLVFLSVDNLIALSSSSSKVITSKTPILEKYRPSETVVHTIVVVEKHLDRLSKVEIDPSGLIFIYGPFSNNTFSSFSKDEVVGFSKFTISYFLEDDIEMDVTNFH